MPRPTTSTKAPISPTLARPGRTAVNRRKHREAVSDELRGWLASGSAHLRRSVLHRRHAGRHAHGHDHVFLSGRDSRFVPESRVPGAASVGATSPRTGWTRRAPTTCAGLRGRASPPGGGLAHASAVRRVDASVDAWRDVPRGSYRRWCVGKRARVAERCPRASPPLTLPSRREPCTDPGA